MAHLDISFFCQPDLSGSVHRTCEWPPPCMILLSEYVATHFLCWRVWRAWPRGFHTCQRFARFISWEKMMMARTDPLTFNLQVPSPHSINGGCFIVREPWLHYSLNQEPTALSCVVKWGRITSLRNIEAASTSWLVTTLGMSNSMNDVRQTVRQIMITFHMVDSCLQILFCLIPM